jgi:hypothetical protein
MRHLPGCRTRSGTAQIPRANAGTSMSRGSRSATGAVIQRFLDHHPKPAAPDNQSVSHLSANGAEPLERATFINFDDQAMNVMRTRKTIPCKPISYCSLQKGVRLMLLPASRLRRRKYDDPCGCFFKRAH